MTVFFAIEWNPVEHRSPTGYANLTVLMEWPCHGTESDFMVENDLVLIRYDRIIQVGISEYGSRAQ